MNVDFPGRIRKTYLADRNGLQPLFEAIINSVDAIEEGLPASGRISVTISRDVAGLSPEAHGNVIADVLAFAVSDNGVGFTTANYVSFETVDTTQKAAEGGKGVGRLLWLKAFERADIESTYQEGGRWFRRRFEFRPTRAGVENHRLDELPEPAPQLTTVRLLGYRPEYQVATPKSAESIGRRIVEHCLEYFMLERIPSVVEVLDFEESVRIDLNQLFTQLYEPEAIARRFSIGGADFQIRDVMLSKEGELTHQLHFCAHNRVVRSIALAGRVEHLPPAIADGDGVSRVYHGYVNSPFLDQHVDAERTDFRLDRRGELGLGGGFTWEDVLDSAILNAAEALEPATTAGRYRAIEQVERFVSEKAPKYRPLLTHRRAAVERLPADLPEAKLDLELYKLHAGWKGELRARTQEQLEDTQAADLDVGLQARLSELLGEIEEASKSELVEYVVQRRAVLDLFQRLLGWQESGRFAREDALHDLMFPRRQTSDDIDYDRHNLWLIDERLAYHLHLSSDTPLSSHGGPVSVASVRRPDLLIYNRAMAFADSTGAVSSVVIVEFKRPERNDYSDGENPVRQVVEYIEDLRSGRARRDDGSTIDLPEMIPFYCYIVATRSPTLKREAKHQDFMPTPDGQGYFKFHAALNAYIEILSYHKILEDAKKRNRAFFERLDLPIY